MPAHDVSVEDIGAPERRQAQIAEATRVAIAIAAASLMLVGELFVRLTSA